MRFWSGTTLKSIMKLLVFTDLDATLLDPNTYSWEAASDAIQALRERQASIILVSSKTRAEMEPIHREIGLGDPFIIENGGGIVVPEKELITLELSQNPALGHPTIDQGWLIYQLGASYAELVEQLDSIATEVGCALKGFSAMTEAEVIALTGLGPQEAANAKKREFDEPFVATDVAKGKQKEIESAASYRGLTVVAGGRFWHLMGHKGKGGAVSILIEAYRRVFTDVHSIGLGDSPNDFPFLEVVDTPILLGDDAVFPLPPSLASRVIVDPVGGPEGWNISIQKILKHVSQ
jgi:mannosyl-3-phosphoglycerate phosphatase